MRSRPEIRMFEGHAQNTLDKFNNHFFLAKGVTLEMQQDQGGFWYVLRRAQDSDTVLRHHLNVYSLLQFLEEMLVRLDDYPKILERIANQKEEN